MNKIILLTLIVLLLVYVLTTSPFSITTESDNERSEPFNSTMPTVANIDATNPSLGLNYPNNERAVIHGSPGHLPEALLDIPPLAPPLPETRPVNPKLSPKKVETVAKDNAQSKNVPNKVQPSANRPVQPAKQEQLMTQPTKVMTADKPANNTYPSRAFANGGTQNLLNMNGSKKYFTEPFKSETLSDKIDDLYDMNDSVDDQSISEEESCDIASKCSADTCGSESLHPILDPRFNMRECAKQCLLLEDHMNNTKKRCFDCIRKHFLITDGLLEEAVSLEQDTQKRADYRDLYMRWLALEKKYSNDPLNSNNMDDVSKEIRMFRKPLVEKYFDLVKDYQLE